MWREDLASQGLGMTIGPSPPAAPTVEMRIRDDMTNGHGIAHGGFIFALADSAFAFACNSLQRARRGAGVRHRVRGSGHRVVTCSWRWRDERHRFGRNGIYDIR